MTVLKQIQKYAESDLQSVLNAARYGLDTTFHLQEITYDCDEDALENSDEEVDCVANARIRVGGERGKEVTLSWTYTYDGDNVYVELDTPSLVKKLEKLINAEGIKGSIKASSVYSPKSRIYGADGDDPEVVDDFDNEYIEDDSFGDELDDLADSVENLQDQVEDEIDEDEVDIELDNNIDGHYIAECERCHGVFISAMLESDQSVDKITGTCPLCEKESDQYLKWIVKAVEKV